VAAELLGVVIWPTLSTTRFRMNFPAVNGNGFRRARIVGTGRICRRGRT